MTDTGSNTAHRCLLVSCHPLQDSLCNHLVDRVKKAFAGQSIELEHLDLYESGFAAPLTAEERREFFTGSFDASALGTEIAALRRAEILVLVFPTWWFGMPALLKGWFDRVWAPDVAFGLPAEPGGRITPKLDGLRHCLVVTTLGSPWWIDTFVMWRPVRRMIKKGLIDVCAPRARFDMLSLHNAMALEPSRLEPFLRDIDAAVTNVVKALPAGPKLPGRYPL